MSSIIASRAAAVRAAVVALLPAFAACSDAPTTPRAAQGAAEVQANAVLRECVRCENPIVFDAGSTPADPVKHIYTVMPDGSELTQLTTGQWSDREPAWSSNYKRIVFTSNRHGGVHNVYSMTSKGQGVTRLTNSAGLPEYSPVLSPDGTKIVWARQWINGGVGILLMNSDGSKEVAFVIPGTNLHPTFSPDGKKILFSSDLHSTSGSYLDRDIYVMNLDGSGRTRLTWNSTYDENPVWTPDGKKIVFESDRGGQPGIYKMDPDGSNVELIQLAPAGAYIGYVSVNAASSKVLYYSDEAGQQWRISSLDGGPSTVVPLTSRLGSLGSASWSFAR
ncbi:MAG TPA: DPP IV N-terminal domain-containing protein [Gemmatimonadaceae bacterium]|nr:DPP IV N-terminal domain-containing protein [Gemmatimonadaceae bacterium]